MSGWAHAHQPGKRKPGFYGHGAGVGAEGHEVPRKKSGRRDQGPEGAEGANGCWVAI